MKFGYFDDKAKEYVITTPHTPLPWINYLGSNDFFSLISHEASEGTKARSSAFRLFFEEQKRLYPRPCLHS